MKNSLPENPEKAFSKLMICEEYSPKNYVENAKRMDFFNDLYQKLGKFSGTSVRQALFVEDYSEDFVAAINSITSSIDFVFAPFTEGLPAFPYFFSGLSGIENIKGDLNCIGRSLTIPVVYSYEKDPFSDLEIRLISSTRRFNKVIWALEQLRKGEKIILDETSPCLLEPSKAVLSSGLEKTYTSAFLKNNPELVYIDVDTFHGIFRSWEIEERLLESALSLDYFKHVHVHNKKNGETYDYPLEVENLGNYNAYDLERGITVVSINQFIHFYCSLFEDRKKLLDLLAFVNSVEPDPCDFMSLGSRAHLFVNLFMVDKLRELVHRIIEITSPNTPANWLIVAVKLGIKTEKEAREEITERYKNPEAFELALKRFN
ncbi:MAG: hypothetical protein QXS91_02210 [Candidatus Anstonellales archaeon]